AARRCASSRTPLRWGRSRSARTTRAWGGERSSRRCSRPRRSPSGTRPAVATRSSRAGGTFPCPDLLRRFPARSPPTTALPANSAADPAAVAAERLRRLLFVGSRRAAPRLGVDRRRVRPGRLRRGGLRLPGFAPRGLLLGPGPLLRLAGADRGNPFGDRDLE